MVHLRVLDEGGGDRLKRSYLACVCCQDENVRRVYDFRAVPDLEQRISEIQEKLDRLSAAVELPGEDREHVALMESRLATLTQQCAEILDKWTLTDLRHTRALGEMEARLGHWEQLETRVEQEWLALREMLEQPVRQLQEHAASLRETSVASAGSALTGLERAESRLATIQADLSDRMSQLSRDVQAVVAELRAGPPRSGRPAAGNMQSWPLEQVMRIHNEHRETDGPPSDDSRPPDIRTPKTITLLPQSAASLSERIESVEHAVATGNDMVRDTFERAEHKRRSAWRTAVIVLAVGLILAAAFTFRMQRQIEAAAARISAAELDADVARARAESQIEAGRKDAERQIAEGQGNRAQSAGGERGACRLGPRPVWAVRRRSCAAGARSAACGAGRAAWCSAPHGSRSRGQDPHISCGCRPNAGSVSVGLAKPDAEGRLSLASDTVPAVLRPVVGVALTLEPSGGVTTPSGAAVLTYRPPL
jgi:Tfp pilus assembly protein PilX